MRQPSWRLSSGLFKETQVYTSGSNPSSAGGLRTSASCKHTMSASSFPKTDLICGALRDHLSKDSRVSGKAGEVAYAGAKTFHEAMRMCDGERGTGKLQILINS
mmetsp:Transcript_38949/g.70296  ORF Transcript_38949/g.70296 Transcript_38949/m.70296 type:complete len:104 (+) Transcript_38949:913-1224(+)